MSTAVIEVDLGERSYPIHVVEEGLSGLGAAAAGVMEAGRAVVVTNPVVGALYRDEALESLRGAHFDPVAVEVPDGEAHKTVATWHGLVEALLDAQVDRHTPIFALGGGVTGDLAGFAAATTLRGLPLVMVPTSLLAMVDSSVGGKTGVNSPRGKNLVGAFHQPTLVFAPMAVLDTLEQAELRSGLGEVLKHGLLGDPELFAICRDRSDDVLARDPELIAELVVRSCRVKAGIVALDEREAGLRAVLNLGHTTGHALETALGHGSLRHGECVALGLIAESRWAASRGSCDPGVPEEVRAVVDRLGLSTKAPAVEPAELLAAAGIDKKLVRGTMTTAVVRAIGKVDLERIALTELPRMLEGLYGSLEAQ